MTMMTRSANSGGSSSAKSIHPSGVPLPQSPMQFPASPSTDRSPKKIHRLSGAARSLANKINQSLHSPPKALKRMQGDAADCLGADGKFSKRKGDDLLKEAPEIPSKSSENRRSNQRRSRASRQSSSRTTTNVEVSSEVVRKKTAVAGLPSSIKATLEHEEPVSPTSAALETSLLNTSRVSFGSPGGSQSSPNRGSMAARRSFFSLEAHDEEDLVKRREHERAVQQLIEQLYRDLEQEKTTVKELLRQERMHQERVRELKQEIDRQRESSKLLVDRLFQSKQDLDQKDRQLQRALQDALTWKQTAKQAVDAQRSLEIQLAMATESQPQAPSNSTTTRQPKKRFPTLDVILRRLHRHASTKESETSRSNQAVAGTNTAKLWDEMKQELNRLREENNSLSKTLMEVQSSEARTKSTQALLDLHRAMVQGMDSSRLDKATTSFRTRHPVAVSDLEASLFDSFERSDDAESALVVN